MKKSTNRDEWFYKMGGSVCGNSEKEVEALYLKKTGRKPGDIVKTIRFKTRLGTVVVDIVAKCDGGWIYDSKKFWGITEICQIKSGKEALTMYDHCMISIIDEKWLRVELDDAYYGSPEYEYMEME